MYVYIISCCQGYKGVKKKSYSPFHDIIFITYTRSVRDRRDIKHRILVFYACIIKHSVSCTYRDQIQAWDLQSFLIKPVQRILKYPLLVDKLVEYTEEKHADRKAIQNARDVIVKMARDINEIKRRKDIGEGKLCC